MRARVKSSTTPLRKKVGDPRTRNDSLPSTKKLKVAPSTKAETILGLLRRPKGASILEMANAAGWQNHSVRGFLSGEIKKKRSLTVMSERVEGVLRYRLAKGS